MSFTIHEIRPQHDVHVCEIIKIVGKEFGAIGEGFGPSDPEVEAMSQHYKHENASLYLVASMHGKVVGGGGIAPFNGSLDICELRKLFLLPESRGLGIGKNILQECLDYAKSKGYKKCYLDSIVNMKSAIALYESFGFQHLERALEGTIHNGCDVWMLKEL